MQSGHGSTARWGLLATVAIHGLLWGGWKISAWQERLVSAPPVSGQVLQVQLVARPRPAALPALAAPSMTAPPLIDVSPTPPAAPEKDAIHYYYPEEVDRELMPRLDPTGDLQIALPHPVVLHLFVDAQGRVNAVTIEAAPEGSVLSDEVQDALRDAFMRMTFLPAKRQGQEVAARMRIEVAASEVPLDAPAPDPVKP